MRVLNRAYGAEDTRGGVHKRLVALALIVVAVAGIFGTRLPPRSRVAL
jgi:uncharacterized BrkB/YihY/UPF0761 family membrane protein